MGRRRRHLSRLGEYVSVIYSPETLAITRRGSGRLHLFVFAALLAGLAATPAFATAAVVLNSDEDTFSVIDTDSYKETVRTHIGRQPHHLIATPDRKNLIIANAGGNELVFIDRPTGTVKQRVEVSDPYQVGFSPDAKWFLTTSLRLDRIDIYNAANYQLVHRLPAPKTPSHIGFSPDSSTAYVTLQGTGQLIAIDLASGQHGEGNMNDHRRHDGDNDQPVPARPVISFLKEIRQCCHS